MTREVTSSRVDDVTTITSRLAAFVTAHYGEGAEVRRVRPMPGHAGLSFGFDVVVQGEVRQSVVMRVPPKGVRRSGNTDVLRQAPLLRALHAEGLPVARVLWAGEDEQWFGVPYLMVEHLAGETCFPWDPPPVWERTGSTIPDLWRQGAATLTQVHAVPWAERLAGWADPRPVVDEIDRWQPVYAQAPEPGWAVAAAEVRQLLLDDVPTDTPVGLLHGDYQIGNLLFADGRLAGVIDWELSGIGAHLLDVGWYLAFADPESWHEAWGPVNPAPVDELEDIYQAGIGRRARDLRWYRALAGYRMGAIACLNVKLHRRGHRPDEVWEKYALATPILFERARQLLLDRRPTTRSLL